MKDLKDILIDFGIPVLILVMCFVLMVTGIDGDVKTTFAGAVGWLLASGIRTKRIVR